MKKLSEILLISLMAVFLAAGSASAIATAYLGVYDGVTGIVIEDNGSLDTDSILGIVSYSGSLGSWNFALTGTSKYVSGSATRPVMDFNAVVSGGMGTFKASFSDIDFVPPGEGNGEFSLYFDGNAGGTVALDAGVDWGNAPFGEADLIVPLGTLGPGDFAKSATGTLVFEGDNDVPYYSLTMNGEFTAGNPVPEPTTMLLFGAGLVGLAGFGRKKLKK